MQVLIHGDEINLKGGNQPLFYRTLIKNLKLLFPHCNARRISGGLWISGVGEDDFGALSKVPGIANFSPAFLAPNVWESILQTLDTIKFSQTIKSFRVTASRSYKSYPLSSAELDKKIGAYLQKKYGWKVDLTNFDLEIKIDIHKDEAVIRYQNYAGSGGLPTGTAGRVLVLLSGGIDSPVAAYQMMKRGAEVSLIHFQNQTSATDGSAQKIFDLSKVLARYQPNVRLFLVPFADLQRAIIMNIPSPYRMILTRRLMFKIAARAARAHGCLALATGDSLGQVASQTLENLTVIYEATPLLKLAPLIGANKMEIVDLAKKIGTLEISTRPYDDCCSMFVAKHPATGANLAEVLNLEGNLDFGIIDAAPILPYDIQKNI